MGRGSCWAMRNWIGLSFARRGVEFRVYLPMTRCIGRNKRLEYLDYTIGEHSRRLLFCAWYRSALSNGRPRLHGLHWWRLHCDWQVKLYPIPGKFISEPDLSYLELQERA